jgi:glycerophosphoryl diester phosphodiesterase
MKKLCYNIGIREGKGGLWMDLFKQCIVAHRGASALVPFENTLEAFEKAIDIGAAIMEFDVRRTADHVMVSYHDDDIKGNKLCDITYDELEEQATRQGFSVPTIEDILKISQGKIFLDIELKEVGYEEELIDLVTKYLKHNEFVMKSFFDEAIIRIKEIDSEIRTGLLLGKLNKEMSFRAVLEEFFPMRRINIAKPDFVSPHYRMLRFGLLKKLKPIPVYVWTVNKESVMKKLLEKGVTGIITDRPDIGLKMIEEERQEQEALSC